MADGGAFVYGCSRDAHAQITQLSDFISPTIVAMWNLRWQVQGFVAAYPEAKQSDIFQRFALGSKAKGNEIQRACIDNSWDEQKSRFASIFLTNTISIFEDFLEVLVGITLSGDAKRRAYKALQYPVAPTGRNYTNAYAELGSATPELTGVFNNTANASRWYSGGKIQALLLCYRVFKEIRNALSHNGGKATQALLDAHQRFVPVATTVDLGVREVPIYSTPVLNQQIILDLYGIYGFSDIILRIIATYDIDLSDRPGALIEIERRLGRIEGAARAHVDPDKQKKRIEGMLRQSFIPSAIQTNQFKKYLRDTDRIPPHWS